MPSNGAAATRNLPAQLTVSSRLEATRGLLRVNRCRRVVDAAYIRRGGGGAYPLRSQNLTSHWRTPNAPDVCDIGSFSGAAGVLGIASLSVTAGCNG